MSTQQRLAGEQRLREHGDLPLGNGLASRAARAPTDAFRHCGLWIPQLLHGDIRAAVRLRPPCLQQVLVLFAVGRRFQ